jgi:thiamine biosynthesis lipoprotein
MRLIHRLTFWLLTIGLALLLAGCQRERLHQQESYVFGTRVEVITWGAPEPEARAATAAVLQEFDRLHRAYHAWEPSELTALNTAIAAGTTQIPVSPELATLLADAKAIAATGDELFNPALGQLIALWGFPHRHLHPHPPRSRRPRCRHQGSPKHGGPDHQRLHREQPQPRRAN